MVKEEVWKRSGGMVKEGVWERVGMVKEWRDGKRRGVGKGWDGKRRGSEEGWDGKGMVRWQKKGCGRGMGW
jgi:hypothetical protein